MAKNKKNKKTKPQRKNSFVGRAVSQTENEYLENDLDLGGVLTISEYCITDEPIDRYPPHIKRIVNEMRELVHNEPQNAIIELHKLREKYPNVPVLLNYLAAAYQLVGDFIQGYYWTAENYRLHPDYLFARINMANIYLKKKQLDKVEEIFEGKYDLKLLYPHRKKFHITEAVSFFSVMSQYFYLKKDKKTASLFYNMAEELDPTHPSVLKAKKEMRNPFLRLFQLIVNVSFLVLYLIIFLPYSLIKNLFKKSKNSQE